MSLRHTPTHQPTDGNTFLIGTGRHPRTTTTHLDPAVLHDENFRFWLATRQPQLRLALPPITDPAGSSIVYTSDHRATTRHQPDADRWPVEQDEGELWTTVEHAWTSYTHAGQPRRDQITVTATFGATISYRTTADNYRS